MEALALGRAGGVALLGVLDRQGMTVLAADKTLPFNPHQCQSRIIYIGLNRASCESLGAAILKLLSLWKNESI